MMLLVAWTTLPAAAFAAKGPSPDAIEVNKLWRSVLKTTFAQRAASSPRSSPLKRESIVFPHPIAMNILPGPVIRPAGSRAILYPFPDLVIWQYAPKTAAHAQYLNMRKKLSGMELVRWCQRNKLSVCAEHELRVILDRFKSFRQRGYRTVNRQWLKYADQRQVAYSFPLPVLGPWYVLPDPTGHHRIKAGAAFAFDLVVKKNGRTYRGSRMKLENYYAWDQPVVAQADGIVHYVRDDQPDVPPGRSGGFVNANMIAVDYGGGIRSMYGHLKRGSAAVKVGERVRTGQVLGRVGNSGASGVPHLHFTLLDCGGFSIKGRFRTEVQRGRSWVRQDGKNLTEGTFIRNPVEDISGGM